MWKTRSGEGRNSRALVPLLSPSISYSLFNPLSEFPSKMIPTIDFHGTQVSKIGLGLMSIVDNI